MADAPETRFLFDLFESDLRAFAAGTVPARVRDIAVEMLGDADATPAERADRRELRRLEREIARLKREDTAKQEQSPDNAE